MIHSLLKLLPPERAHAIAKWAMRRRLGAPGPYRIPLVNPGFSAEPYQLFGVSINNPLGLAAGFDKNGELVGAAREYGFGFLEVGSVTCRGGPGNPKPRLFRMSNGDLFNRMGLNGDPARAVAARLAKAPAGCRYGVSIAKTHDPDIMGGDALDDILGSYRLLREYGIYTVLNISCPNTREGRTFEDPGALRELLCDVTKFRPTKSQEFPLSEKPLLLKLSPTLVESPTTLSEIVGVARRYNIDGFVVSNTYARVIADQKEIPGPSGKGGQSGEFVRQHSLLLIKLLRAIGWTKTIIGCGGIFKGAHMLDYKLAGADLFQAYNGFVSGPLAGRRFAHRILADYEKDKLRWN